MGKIILCSGSRTTKPYVFPNTGTRIYSIEELCYYIYQHIYFIEEELFTDALLDWIGIELKLKERADKLKQLKQSKADLKNLITVILCSADYYSENEIKGIIKIIDDLSRMTPLKKRSLRASNYFKLYQYVEAAKEYEIILNSKDANELTPKEYGDILHNLAIAKVHTNGITDAMNIFKEAYVRNQNIESLKQYLYACKLMNDDILFKEEADKYLVDQSIREELERYLEKLNIETEEWEEWKRIQYIKNQKEEGRVNVYYQKIGETIDSWKVKIRQAKALQ